MLNYVRMAWRYITRYPIGSLVLWASITLSVFLIVVIGSLGESSRNADLKNVKAYEGQQHVVYTELNTSQTESSRQYDSIKESARLFYYDDWKSSNQFLVNLLAADRNILYMEDTALIKGRFPNRVNEIAVESWVLERLRLPQQLGQSLEIFMPNRGETQHFKLVGIIKDRLAEKSSGQMEAYIAFDQSYLPGRENHISLLVEFKPGVNITEEIKRLAGTLDCPTKNVMSNRSLLEAMGQLDKVDWDLVKIALLLALVGGMVIYSVYSISILRRVREYGVMRAVGATAGQLVHILMAEILILCAAGILCGIIGGIAFVHLFAGMTTDLFTTTEVIGQSKLDVIVISAAAIKLAIAVALASILAAGIRTAVMTSRVTPVEAINRHSMDAGLSGRETVLERLPGVPWKIALKNLRRNKKALWFTVLTMSVGCSVLLIQSYKLELFDRARDYLDGVYPSKNYEFRLNVNNSVPMQKGYTREQIDAIRTWPQVRDVSAQQILYARAQISPSLLNGANGRNYLKSREKWLTQMDHRNTDIIDHPEEKMRFAFPGDDGQLLIRTTMEGLTDEELAPLNDLLSAGSFDIRQMRQQPLAVLYIPEVYADGTSYARANPKKDDRLKPILKIKPGDRVTISYPRAGYEKSLDNWNLIYQYGKYKDMYREQEFTVAGIIKNRYLPEKDTFHLGSNQDPYLLISNQMFTELFGVPDYRIVSIDMRDDAGSAAYRLLQEKVLGLAELIPGTGMSDRVADQDYQRQARVQYLLLYISIAAVLMIISALSIYNNISYNLISRLHEHGILKAIGLSRKQFRNMLWFEGLTYGGLSAVFSCGLALVMQAGIFIYYVHLAAFPLEYKQFFIEWKLFLAVILINLLIGWLATIGAARQVNKVTITEAIRAVE